MADKPNEALRARVLAECGDDFNPNNWTWCVNYNRVKTDNDVYQSRACVYIMGCGAEQCMFTCHFGPSVTTEHIKRMIRATFGIDRVLDGVG